MKIQMLDMCPACDALNSALNRVDAKVSELFYMLSEERQESAIY
jgi:hypothetical protein